MVNGGILPFLFRTSKRFVILSLVEMFFYNSFPEEKDFTQVLQLDITSRGDPFPKQWMVKEIVIKLKRKNKDRNKIGKEKKIIF